MLVHEQLMAYPEPMSSEDFVLPVNVQARYDRRLLENHRRDRMQVCIDNEKKAQQCVDLHSQELTWRRRARIVWLLADQGEPNGLTCQELASATTMLAHCEKEHFRLMRRVLDAKEESSFEILNPQGLQQAKLASVKRYILREEARIEALDLFNTAYR